MRPPTVIASFLIVLASLHAAPAAHAQYTEPLTVFEANGHTGFFCSFEVNESGDYPDIITVRNAHGIQTLSSLLPSDGDGAGVAALAPGTPVTYSVKVLYLYDESGEAMMSVVGATAIRVDPDSEPSPGACLLPGGQLAYAADAVSGIFCGSEPSQDDRQPGKIALESGQGIVRLSAWLDTADSFRALAALAPGTPVLFDLAVMRVFGGADGGETPPEPGITGIRAVSDPVPGACAVAEKSVSVPIPGDISVLPGDIED
ncbi:MAG: hypothetical protein LBR80_18585 [Deltaproteobacteria bacterium]|jgi:hypothetical protein|nr:hypothetical protein [Deltaproteobacteria bacterium]